MASHLRFDEVFVEYLQLYLCHVLMRRDSATLADCTAGFLPDSLCPLGLVRGDGGMEG